MPFTFTLDDVPIGWAELIVMELEGNQTRDHFATGWGELHPYQSFEELRSLLLINRAARSGPAGRTRTKLHAIGKLELFGPSNVPIATRNIYLDEITPHSYFVAYVTFQSDAACIAGILPPIPSHGLNAAKIQPTEPPRRAPSPTKEDRATD